MHDETFRRCASQFDTTPYNHWINGDYTKIVVTVNSEQELLDIHNKAIEKRLLCSLVQDKGYTEFNNIPTYTCVAIGPDYSEKIDEITKDLKLY
jgi:PTH2 family peptidyl-tRNA hydrolase